MKLELSASMSPAFCLPLDLSMWSGNCADIEARAFPIYIGAAYWQKLKRMMM